MQQEVLQSKPKPRSRRAPSFRVNWELGTHTVNASQWQQAVARGWIIPIDTMDGTRPRAAGLARGVTARLREGVLHLRDSLSGQSISIYTSWASIDRIAPPRGEFYQREIESQYGGPSYTLRDSGLPWYERCPGPLPAPITVKGTE